ncbi:MAG: hypothetical protein WCI03_10585 [bacterium]
MSPNTPAGCPVSASREQISLRIIIDRVVLIPGVMMMFYCRNSLRACATVMRRHHDLQPFAPAFPNEFWIS